MRILLFLMLIVLAPAAAEAPACRAPEPVCAVTDRVVGISAFEPVGSATVVADGLLVTNRHMLADLTEATVQLPDGRRFQASILPTDYPGDLILLEAPELKGAVPFEIAPSADGPFYVVGFDVGREAIRVYAPGELIVPVADAPLARLHMDARALPGNSGGAVVDAKGRLVGVVASGGEGRNEAIPVAEVARLREASSLDKIDASDAIGKAYRDCATILNESYDRQGPFDPETADQLSRSCLASNNRQLMDLAGQAFGTRRDVARSLEMLEASYDQDPNAPNALISLAITYHLAGRFEDEIPVLRRGLELLPDEPQLLRFALQAGIWGGDQALADHAMARIEETLPGMAPAARRFYEAAPPPPRRQ